MKWLVWIVVLFVTFGLLAEDLPEADPDKDLWQKTGTVGVPIAWPKFGGMRKVKMPVPKTIEELKRQLAMKDLASKQAIKEQMRQQKAKEHRFGSWVKRIGWLVLAAGFACHFLVAWPMLKSVASSIMTVGVVMVGAGLGIQKTVEYDTLITLCLAVPIGIFVLWKARGWSVSHLWKKRPKLSDIDSSDTEEPEQTD